MARKTQSFFFQKHIENEASSFRLHPFMGLLSWALQLDLHAFRRLPGLSSILEDARYVLRDKARGAEAFRQRSSFGADTDPLVEDPKFSVCQQLSL